MTLPIASCVLKLDDEAVRVAVGLRLGLNLCVPRQCECGAPFDGRGTHSFVCKQAPREASRHHAEMLGRKGVFFSWRSRQTDRQTDRQTAVKTLPLRLPSVGVGINFHVMCS